MVKCKIFALSLPQNEVRGLGYYCRLINGMVMVKPSVFFEKDLYKTFSRYIRIFCKEVCLLKISIFETVQLVGF